ncbi:hypothetical protein TUN205_10529, partial [Pyrenophora tritici-repentis]
NPSEPSELLASAQLAEQANWLSSLSLLIDICATQPTRSRSQAQRGQKRTNTGTAIDTTDQENALPAGMSSQRPQRTIMPSRRALEAISANYSIRNSRDIVMATLLRDPQIHEYNILAIQEPWRNPYTATTHHPAKDIFHLCYPAAADEEGPARVCFFVNKRIDHNRWHFKEHSRDICSLVIEPSRDQQEQQSVAVHNIYNAVGGGGP